MSGLFQLVEAEVVEVGCAVGFDGHVEFDFLGLSEGEVVESGEHGVGDLGAVDVLVDVFRFDGEVSPVEEAMGLEYEGVGARGGDVEGLGEDQGGGVIVGDLKVMVVVFGDDGEVHGAFYDVGHVPALEALVEVAVGQKTGFGEVELVRMFADGKVVGGAEAFIEGYEKVVLEKIVQGGLGFVEDVAAGIRGQLLEDPAAVWFGRAFVEKTVGVAVVDVIAVVRAFQALGDDDLPVGGIDPLVILQGLVALLVRGHDVVRFDLAVEFLEDRPVGFRGGLSFGEAESVFGIGQKRDRRQ